MEHNVEEIRFEDTRGWITTRPDPREQIREGAKAHVNEKTLTVDIDTGTPGYIYDVDLERCNTPAQMLDWIFQVKHKNWCTPQVLYDLLTALDVASEIFHGRTVQGLVRSWEANRSVSWRRQEKDRRE